MRTSLKEHSTHLVDEWSEENYPLTPEKITYGSNKKVLWKGKCGHKWSAKNTPLSPDEICPKSRRNVWWTCKTCGYEWKAVVNARVKGSGCPVCSNRKVLVGYNDLSTTDKHILLDWDSLFIRGVFLFFCFFVIFCRNLSFKYINTVFFYLMENIVKRRLFYGEKY